MSNTPVSLAALGAFFDGVIAAHGLKSDAGLARALKVAPPVISKHRGGKLPVGAAMVLKLHTTFHIPVAEILALVQTPPAAQKKSPRDGGLQTTVQRKNNMPTISHSRLMKLPRVNSRPHRLLRALLAGPGTFYQVCERAGLNIEMLRDESITRALVADLLCTGAIQQRGIVYAITPRARMALEIAPEPFCGQMAAPHYRGAAASMPVLVTRRAGA